MFMHFVYNMDTVGIVAPKQSGKTTLTKKFIKDLPQQRVYILDSNSEYKNFKNRYIPLEYSFEELSRFIRLCRQRKNILIVLDDIDLFINSYKREGEFKRLLINGSHQNIGVIYSAKRINTISKLLFTETKHLFVGSMWNIDDINYLKGVYRRPQALKELKRFQFLYRDRDKQNEKVINVTP